MIDYRFLKNLYTYEPISVIINSRYYYIVYIIKDIKYNYMNKFVQSMNKFKQLDSEQQMILYLYVLKNKSCYYMADRLKVSEKTFF